MTMHRGTRKKPFRDESTIRSFTINTIDMTIFRGITFRCFWFNDVVEEYIGVNSVNPCKDLTYTTIAEKITTWGGLVEKEKMGHLFTRDRGIQRWTCFYPDFNKQTYFYESKTDYLFVTNYYHKKRFYKNCI